MKNKFNIDDVVIFVIPDITTVGRVYNIEKTGCGVKYQVHGISKEFYEEDLFFLSEEGIDEYYKYEHKKIINRRNKLDSIVLNLSERLKSGD